MGINSLKILSLVESLLKLFSFDKAGVDTGCFRHWYTNFGCTNLGELNFNLK